MFKIFNTNAISKHQRFTRALLVGIPTSLILAIVYGLIQRALPIEFEIAYIAIGYAIGYVIKEYGHGVHLRFSILAVVLTVLCFSLSETLSYVSFNFVITHPIQIIISIFTNIISWFSFYDISSLLHLLFIIVGVYEAYSNARIF